MEEFVPQVEQPDMNNPPDNIEPPQGGQAPVEAEGAQKKSDHPVGEVEIQPPVGNSDKDKLEVGEEEEEEEGGSSYTIDQLQFMMGLSLVVGFVFMLLVDQCGGGHGHSHMTGEQGWGGEKGGGMG